MIMNDPEATVILLLVDLFVDPRCVLPKGSHD